jgi:hypothetical protein
MTEDPSDLRVEDTDMVDEKREPSISSGSPGSSDGDEPAAVRRPWTKRTFKRARRSRASSGSMPPLGVSSGSDKDLDEEATAAQAAWRSRHRSSPEQLLVDARRNAAEFEARYHAASLAPPLHPETGETFAELPGVNLEMMD